MGANFLLKIINYLRMVLIYAFFFSSCSSDDESDPMTDYHLHITVINSIGGLGDMGYNDQIMSGIMHFYEANDVSMNLVRPNKKEEADQAFQQWQAETRDNGKSLLVLAGSEYETLVAANNVALAENQQVLLVESKNKNLPEGVSTFYINRYGASYLAGCMAKEHEAATIIAAMPHNSTLEEAIAGFSDGYRTHSQKEAQVVYLADDESGFNMPDKAYQTMGDIYNAFVFPLAGGSNTGVYKYSREASFYLPLIVGMDTDCSMYSDRIPFSMIIHINKVVEQYLTDWLNDVPLEKNQVFGLESGMIDIVMSPVFYRNMDVWEDYYDSEDYWMKAYQNHKVEAIGKEEAYEKN